MRKKGGDTARFGLVLVQSGGGGSSTGMDSQAFTGNPLARSLDILRAFDGSSNPSGSQEVALIVVAGRSVCVRSTNDLGGGEQDLQALLLGITDPQLDLNSEHISFWWSDMEGAQGTLRRRMHARSAAGGLCAACGARMLSNAP